MHAAERKASLWPATAAAFAMLVASGVGFRLLASEYVRSSESIHVPVGTLATLPLEINGWFGSEVVMDERVLRATDTDDHVNRIYRRGPGEAVALFIGYGVNLRDLAPHRPEVCYPGAGWTLDQTRLVEDFEISEEPGFACQIHDFHRGGLAGQRVTVLNYYIVDGQFCGDVSLLRSRAWRGGGDSTYAAQVQIVDQVGTSPIQAEQAVRAFAADSARQIRTLLVSAVDAALSAEGAEGG